MSKSEHRLTKYMSISRLCQYLHSELEQYVSDNEGQIFSVFFEYHGRIIEKYITNPYYICMDQESCIKKLNTDQYMQRRICLHMNDFLICNHRKYRMDPASILCFDGIYDGISENFLMASLWCTIMLSEVVIYFLIDSGFVFVNPRDHERKKDILIRPLNISYI